MVAVGAAGQSSASAECFDGPATCRAPGCPHPLTGETVCPPASAFAPRAARVCRRCSADRLLALTMLQVPATLGHENCGTIVELHPSLGGTEYAANFPIGTRVVMEPVISCRECPPCLAGDRGLCEVGIAFFGYNRPGGLAPYMNVTAENLHRIPEGVPLDVAALAEPLAVAWHAVGRSNFKPGETALVIGAGPIGALVTR